MCNHKHKLARESEFFLKNSVGRQSRSVQDIKGVPKRLGTVFPSNSFLQSPVASYSAGKWTAGAGSCQRGV